MKNMPNEIKAMMVQSCINCYFVDEKVGAHGNLDWSFVKGGFKGIKWFDINNSEGYTAVINIPGIGEAGLVAYEGSSKKDGGKDWKENFNAGKVKKIEDETKEGAEMIIPYGNSKSKIKMHKGFYNTYQHTRELTRDYAKWCHKTGLPYFVTGHSLGGALTTLDFIDKQYMFNDEMKVSQHLCGYAAASPKVFNWDGAVSFNNRADGNFYRENYGNDTVAETPPFTGLGYVHVKEGKRWSNLRDNFLFPFTHILHFVTLGFLPSVGFYDHDPRKLKAAILGKPIPVAKLDTVKDPDL